MIAPAVAARRAATSLRPTGRQRRPNAAGCRSISHSAAGTSTVSRLWALKPGSAHDAVSPGCGGGVRPTTSRAIERATCAATNPLRKRASSLRVEPRPLDRMPLGQVDDSGLPCRHQAEAETSRSEGWRPGRAEAQATKFQSRRETVSPPASGAAGRPAPTPPRSRPLRRRPRPGSRPPPRAAA